jgi:hypothetical protein
MHAEMTSEIDSNQVLTRKEKDNYMKNNPGLSKDAAEYLVEKIGFF